MATKKEHKFFNIMEYEKEAEYLRSMHKAGWNFLRISGLGTYHFVDCEPADYVYQLDYNQEGRQNRAEYLQMFADCGWEYLQDYMGYSYFRKPASECDGSEEIFCDDESRLQMVERIFKGRLLPLLVIFCCVLIPQFINCITLYHAWLVAAFLGGCIAVYIGVFVAFGLMYIRYKNKLGR